eukprot:4687937-Ditylum_brightwellii.AAC.1
MKMLPLVIHHSKDSFATILSFKAVSALPAVEIFCHNKISDIFMPGYQTRQYYNSSVAKMVSII